MTCVASAKQLAIHEPVRMQARRATQPLIVRSPHNPILTADMIPGSAACVFNSGVVFQDDQFIMMANVWDREWAPKFMVARSTDAVHFTINPANRFTPPDEHPYVPHEGIFDSRITAIDGAFLITYNVASRLGGRIRLARTKDFEHFEDLGFIAGPDHRNCVIFPEKINGQYVRLERPNVDDAGDIYISTSPDLIHWGNTKLLLERNHRYWASAKIGPGAPPVRTNRGWLCIYHGTRLGMNGHSYQAGAMLLDLDDPTKVIGNMNACLLEPTADYERAGITPNVVFPTAAVPVDNDQLLIYYGCADTCMGLAIAQTTALVDACVNA